MQLPVLIPYIATGTGGAIGASEAVVQTGQTVSSAWIVVGVQAGTQEG